MLSNISKWLFEQYAWSSDYSVAAQTDIGGRTINQDYQLCLKLEQHVLLVVADGLGGHQAGELAAKGFCQALAELVGENEAAIDSEAESLLNELIRQAAEKMSQYVGRQVNTSDAHTTFAFILIHPDYTYWAHIGDTRIYLFDQNKMLLRTRDDSVAQRLLDNNEIEQVAAEGMQNLLEKTVSMNKPPEPNICKHAGLKRGQGVLICTDGLWTNLTQTALHQLSQSTMLKKDLAEAVSLAKRNGGERCDNITAIVARLKDAG